MKKILLTFSLFLISWSIDAQEENWRYYFSMENINDLAESGAFLWFATDHGVVKMNKNTLDKTYFTTANSNLPESHVQSIVIGPQGLPWIGTYDIIMARFDGEDWTDAVKIPEMDSLSGSFSNWNPTLYTIEVDKDGIFWLGTNDGLVRYDGSHAHVFNGNNVEASFFRDVWDITFDQGGNVFVSGFELLKYDTLGNWTNYTTDYPDFFAYGGTSLHCDVDGTVWYHNSFSVLASLKEEEWTVYDFFTEDNWDPIAPSSLTYFSEDAEGKLLACAPGRGLYQLQDTVWVQFSTLQTEANNNQMTNYFVDKEDRSWLINNGFMTRYEEEDLTEVYVSEYPFFTNRFSKITGDKQDNVYILENGQRLVQYNEAEGMRIYDEFKLGYEDQANYIWDMHITESGEKWIGAGQSLFHHDGEGWEHFFGSDSETPMSGYYIASNKNGHLAIPSYKKLARFDGQQWDFFNTDNSPLNQNFPIYAVEVDQNNVVWALGNDYNNGNWTYRIYRLERDNWETWHPGHTPIPSGAYLAEAFVDTDNNLWVATYYAGVYKFDGQNWTHYEHEMLEGVSISNIYQDEEGLMYFCSYKGLFMFDGAEWSGLTTENAPLLGDQIHSVYKDGIGSLWTASYDEGINVYNENGFVTAIEPLEVLEQKNLKVFPNPARGFVTLEFESDTSGEESFITLSNLNGQQISTYNLGKRNTGLQKVPVSVSALPEGIYILSVINDQGIRTARVVVK